MKVSQRNLGLNDKLIKMNDQLTKMNDQLNNININEYEYVNEKVNEKVNCDVNMNVNDTECNKKIVSDDQKGMMVTQIDEDDDIYVIEECNHESNLKDNLSKSQLKE